MKRTNKKGFTLVELVIVIAIIAILAAVLIPTFAGVVRKANESAALQSARNAYTAIMAETDAEFKAVKNVTTVTVGTTSNLNCVVDEGGNIIIDLDEYFGKIDSAEVPSGESYIKVVSNKIPVYITATGASLTTPTTPNP